MFIKPNSNLRMISLIFLCAVSLSVSNCKSEDDDDEDSGFASTGYGTNSSSSSDQSGFVPQISSINLDSVGSDSSSSLALNGERNCDQGNDGGVFGFALGGACHTAPMAAEILLGDAVDGVPGDTDGSGTVDCDDLDEDSSGVLMHLICEEMLSHYSKVTSLSFDEGDEGSFGVSFADFSGDDMTAVGSWTQGDEEGTFPANITMFQGDDFDNLSPMMGVALEDLDNGQVFLDVSDTDMEEIKGHIQFGNTDDGDDCASDTSEANCYWQEIKLYFGDGDIENGPPNGFHLKIYADSKESPTFLAMEGKYYFSSDNTSAKDIDDDLSTVYFTVIQKGDQVWGQFEFYDSDGSEVGSFGDITTSDGICYNLGTLSGDGATCDDIDADDYSSLWEGATNFEEISSSPISSVEFGDAPADQGLCTTEGCEQFD